MEEEEQDWWRQIDEIKERLNSIELTDSLKLSILSLIETILESNSAVEYLSSSSSTRTSLLLLIINLTRRHKLILPTQLTISLIVHYTQLNRSIIQEIIELHFHQSHQFKHELTISIDRLVQRLSSQPNQLAQSSHHLRLISQSHPQALEIFYRSRKSLHSQPTTIFTSILRIIEHHDRTLIDGIEIRRELTFIILSVLKYGIIPRLKQATIAFDSTEIIHQLVVLLQSKSTQLVNDLYLNYPDFIDQVEHLTRHHSDSRLSIESKNRLKSILTNPSDHLILQVYRYHQPSKSEDRFDSIVDRISSVLPDLDPQLLKLIIQNNPEFQDPKSGPEEFIEKTFNESDFIDSNLIKFQSRTQENLSLIARDQQSPQIMQVLRNRQNVFDNRLMDVRLLKQGKSALDENQILNDKSHLTHELKMKIKSRLEALDRIESENPDEQELVLYSDDDDEDDKRKGKTRVFVHPDIFSDDDELFFSMKNEKDKNQDTSDSNLSPSESESKSPIHRHHPKSRSNQPRDDLADRHSNLSKNNRKLANKNDPASDWSVDEQVLCSYYILHPQVFSSKSRSSKLRAQLKSKLVHTQQDDLIESWKVMFDRSPRKEEILGKYDLFTNSNQQSSLEDQSKSSASIRQQDTQWVSTNDPGGPSRSRAERGQGRGRGRGRGRGNGGFRSDRITRPNHPNRPTGQGPSESSSTTQANRNEAGHHQGTLNDHSASHQSDHHHHSKPKRGGVGGADHRKKINDRRVRGRDKKLAQFTAGSGL